MLHIYISTIDPDLKMRKDISEILGAHINDLISVLDDNMRKEVLKNIKKSSHTFLPRIRLSAMSVLI